MENSDSKFQDLYKTTNRIGLQELRRQTLLKEQKLQRALFQDEARGLQSIVTKVKCSAKFKQKWRFFKSKYQINHKLQLSEWMTEKPEDFTEWFLVPCPKGRRCMVIACNGITEMYNKAGRLLDTFHSQLPGNVGSKKDVTILDCIFVESQSTFYVLDTLAYGIHDFVDCEAQFRFFWLTNKFLESRLDEISPMNTFAFVCLEFYDFEDSNRVSMGLQQYPLWKNNKPELDGFLFYHKESSYTFGTTPLVGWLFAYMVPEVLELPVNPVYLNEKPDGYTDCIRYMADFNEALSKKRHKATQRRSSSKMDEDVPQEEEDLDDENAFLKALLKSQKDLELENEAEDIPDDA